MATTADDWSIYWKVPVAYGYEPDGDDYYTIKVDTDGYPLSKLISMLDFWSSIPAFFETTPTPGDKTLADVVIPDLGSYVITAAYAMFQISVLTCTSGARGYPDGNQFIQVDKAAAGYTNAVIISSRNWTVEANSVVNNFQLLIGDIDISARVANNATTNFKWTSAKSVGTLGYHGVRTGIRLIIKGA